MTETTMTTAAAAVDDLAHRFWQWRRNQAPRTRDDIPRMDRPEGWRPAWTAADVARYRVERAGWEQAVAALGVGRGDGPAWTDARLLGSACARVRWELDVVAGWERDPWFYLDQTLGTIFDLLVRPAPFTEGRGREIEGVLASFPATLAAGKENLSGRAFRELAVLAVEASAQAPEQLRAALAALRGAGPAAMGESLEHRGEDAAAALGRWWQWLSAEAPAFRPWTPIGRDQLGAFFSGVALVPDPPEALLAAAAQEEQRAIVWELLEEHRHPSVDPPALPADADEQCRLEDAAEVGISAMYEAKNVLSQPPSFGRYLNRPLPPWLVPLRWLGVTDDLTGPARLDQDGVSYVPPPAADLPYFYRANASDPRAGIMHEGAHYQQLVRAWRHERPARRWYYDSCPNEGIAFYNEELFLQLGVFDDAPTTRRVVYNFMRLRAVRVEVDIRLALGVLSVQEAADVLESRVPMDRATAWEEAAFFAGNPGQGSSYTVGKLQIMRLLAAARVAAGASFDLREFHDWLWANGNVPLALLRWELLGDPTDIDALHLD
jgi:hypothetical protein